MNPLTRLFGSQLASGRPRQVDRQLRLLEKALETTQLGVTITDARGKILFTNRADAEMHGYEVDELIGRDVRIFAPRELWRPMDRDRLRQIRSLRRETTNVRRDGTTFPVQILSDVVLDEDGEPVGVVSTCEDISQRKEIERRLKILGKVFETTKLGVTVSDPDGKILYANPAEAEMHGREVRDLVNQDVRIFAPKELWNPMSAQQLRRLHTRPRQSINVRQDGTTFPVQLMSDLVSDGDGEPIAVVTTCEDISLTTAIEQVAEAIMVTDDAGTIRYVNPAFEKITGYPREEAVGREWSIVRSDRHEKGFYRGMWSTLEGGEVWQGRLTVRRQDGGQLEGDATISPVRDPRGTITGFVFVSRDVTREVMLDEQLRQSQKMEAVGQLAGGVAHDFNNLLVGIQGYALLALEALPPDAPVHDDLLEIQRAAERAAALTRQLLAFSRRQVLQPVDLALDEVIRDLLKMLHRVISEDIELALVPGADLRLVRADLGQVEQVIMNLVVNARDAMPEGGTITLRTENADLDPGYCERHAWARPGHFVRLSVTDTGCGIPEEMLPRIFEPFFTTKGVNEGTGLGLATVHGIVEQHRGLIHVSSRSGEGTVVEVYLPVSDRHTAEAGAAKPAAAPGGRETILLAEDDEMVRRLGVRILERAGYTVLIAENGHEAVRLFERHRGDVALALLDMIMPVMGGIEARERILALEPAARVLFASGYSAEAGKLGSRLGADIPLIAKPYHPTGLLAKVREVLDA